jgi:hypothetical protein
MTRCNQCYSLITRKDDERCYICGEPVPGARKRSRRRATEPKPVTPITPLSNLLFIASLALTVISFLSSHKMSLSLSATLSAILLIARVWNDRMAARQQLALRPVTVPRLDH